MKYRLEIECDGMTYGQITEIMLACTGGAALYNTDMPEVGESWPINPSIGNGKIEIVA